MGAIVEKKSNTMKHDNTLVYVGIGCGFLLFLSPFVICFCKRSKNAKNTEQLPLHYGQQLNQKSVPIMYPIEVVAAQRVHVQQQQQIPTVTVVRQQDAACIGRQSPYANEFPSFHEPAAAV